MKEFELTLKLRNNLIKRRRLQMGLGAREAANQAGVHYALWLKYEALTADPLAKPTSKRGATWRPSAVSIARFFGCLPEDLFPDVVLAVKRPEVQTELAGEQALILATAVATMELPPVPDELLIGRETTERIRELMPELNTIERRIIRSRFEDDKTLAETGEAIGLSQERTRQLQNRALRKLRDGLDDQERVRR